jgi:hypothetical protein
MYVDTISPFFKDSKTDAANSYFLDWRQWYEPPAEPTFKAPVWTLEHKGVEKSLESWGIKRMMLSQRHQVADRFTFEITQSTGAILFATDDQVILRKGRLPQTNGFSEGRKIWVGWATKPTVDKSAKGILVTYEFAGLWGQFEDRMLMSPWTLFDPSKNAFVEVKSTHLFMGVKYTPDKNQLTRLNVGETLDWIVKTARSQYGIPAQAGANYPTVPFLYFEIRDMSISAVIQKVMARIPDAIFWVDNSGEIPVCNVQHRKDQTAVTLTAKQKPLSTYKLSPRYDARPPCVVLKYERKNQATVDGKEKSVVQYLDDYGGDPNNPAPETAARALVSTINLYGTSRQSTSAVIAIRSLYLNNADFWERHIGWLTDARIQSWTFPTGSTVVLSPEGYEVNGQGQIPGFTNELIDGSIAAWMKNESGDKVTKVELTAKRLAEVSYYDDAGNLHTRREVLSARFKATNANKSAYNSLSSFEAGESKPEGLAQYYWESLQQIQYDGQVFIHEKEVGDWLEARNITSTLGMGLVLNITGDPDDPNLATARCQIQGVDIDFERGMTTLTVGPPHQLTPQDIHAILRENRKRFIYEAPASMNTGETSDKGEVALGENVADSESSSGAQTWQRFMASSAASGNNPARSAMLDTLNGSSIISTAPNATGESPGEVRLQTYKPTGETVDVGEILQNKKTDGSYQVSLSTKDLNGKNVKYQETVVYVEDENGVCSPMKCMIPRSDYYS